MPTRCRRRSTRAWASIISIIRLRISDIAVVLLFLHKSCCVGCYGSVKSMRDARAVLRSQRAWIRCLSTSCIRLEIRDIGQLPQRLRPIYQGTPVITCSKRSIADAPSKIHRHMICLIFAGLRPRAISYSSKRKMSQPSQTALSITSDT